MRRRRRQALAIALTTAALLAAAPPARAHTDLASSHPGDGASMEAPVAEIRLTFNEPVTPAGDGIVLVNANGAAVASSLEPDGDATFVLTPDQPLASGDYGVAWSVRAGDAHPVTGTIVFSVTAPPAAVQPGGPGDEDPADTPPAVPPSPAEDASITIDFADSASRASEWLGHSARWIGYSGGLLGIGGLVFAATALRGSRREALRAVFWARRGGLALIAGALLETVAGAALLSGTGIAGGFSPEAVGGYLGGWTGVAVGLRFTGGAGLLWGVHPSAVRDLPAARGAGGPSTNGNGVTTLERTTAGLDLTISPAAVWASGLVLLSFVFDGHTVTASPAWIVRVSALLHAAAGAVWAGGVAFMAATLMGRRRRGEPIDGAAMAVRFSSIAAVALGAVGIAGGLLALSILDGLGELFSTPWGRLLIVKLALVLAAGAAGAYNHFVVVPRLDARPDDGEASLLLARSVRIEAFTLAGVLAVTAVLVASAS